MSWRNLLNWVSKTVFFYEIFRPAFLKIQERITNNRFGKVRSMLIQNGFPLLAQILKTEKQDESFSSLPNKAYGLKPAIRKVNIMPISKNTDLPVLIFDGGAVWFSKPLSFVMRPHGMNNHDMFLRVNTINKPMLDIDSSRMVSVQITDKLFIRRGYLKWVFRKQYQQGHSFLL